MLRRWGEGWLGFLCLLLACASFGAVAGKVRTLSVAAPVLAGETRPVAIEGVIAEIDAGARLRRIRLAVTAMEGVSPAETPRYVRFSVRGEIAFAPGRSVRCRAILSPPPRPVVPGDYAFHRDAWFQQLGAVGFSVGECRPLARAPPSDLWSGASFYIGALRRAIAEHVHQTAGLEGGGMAASMISGDRSFITPEDAEALRVSGLAHLISISGVHMVLAGGAFFIFVRMLWPLFEPLALRIPVQRIAAAAAIVACSLYFLISGGEVATQRAYIMALIGFGAKLLDRPAISLRSLAVSMVCVVALQPETVVTPGFQMSFAASAALVALYEIWPRLESPGARNPLARIRGWVVGAVATSLAASAATFPFALYHFDRAATWSVLANIAASPIIMLWTTPAAVAAAIASLVGFEEHLFGLMGESLAWVMRIAHIASDASPNVSLPVFGTTSMVAAACGIGLFVVLNGFARLVAFIPAGIALALWMGSPRVVGYVSAVGAVYLRTGETWLLADAWRGESGMRPLAVGPSPGTAPCDGLDPSARCVFEMEGGRVELAPVPSALSGEPGVIGDDSPLRSSRQNVCPQSGTLTYIPDGPAAPLRVDPCAIAGRGGGAIEAGPFGRRLRLAPPEGRRPWTG
jgi:competence protein ComEC